MFPARLLLILFAFATFQTMAAAQAPTVADTDHDGLSDQLEQQLLAQFAPDFRIGVQDCAGAPARFQAGVKDPVPEREDGTVYGQVFPVHDFDPLHPVVEVHFYHLWGRDCGSHGHSLDTEHVAVLLHGSAGDLAAASWKAEYWYAAAHENTVCDVSQITRASTLHAETHGATVWISPGKHASFLDQRLCERGCGADRCQVMKRLPMGEIVNLGEPHRPMNGLEFQASARWPLLLKMSQSNFGPEPVARLNALPGDEIAWYNPGRHPAQGVIAISGATEASLAESGANTSAAISVAGGNTGSALGRGAENTGSALDHSAQKTGHALGTSARRVKGALSLHPSHKRQDGESGKPTPESKSTPEK